MNPQPHPFVGQLGVLIFSLLVAYFALTNKGKKISFSDRYDIGYIYDTPIEIVEYVEPVRRPRKTATRTKTRPASRQQTQPQQQPQPQQKPQAPQKPQIDQQLFDDCVLALVSLGSKKNEAKKTTKDIFDKHNPKTIEDFIKFVCVK